MTSGRTENYEALWIEIENVNKRNVLCAVLYRHPGSNNLDSFTDYLFSKIHKIQRKNKYVLRTNVRR